MKRLFVILWLLCGPALADSGMLMGGVANRQMPLDAISTPSRAYSLQRLLTAYTTNKSINIVRASDSATTDIGFTAAGFIDTTTATAFCNATTCKIITWYDQSGNADNVTQGTDSLRPSLIFNCLGSFPCVQVAAATLLLETAGNFTPATGLVSISTISNRSSGTGVCNFIRQNGAANNRLGGRNAAVGVTLTGGSGGNIIVSNTVVEPGWNAANGVINAASSFLMLNGSDNTGTATGSTTAGKVGVAVGVASTTCNLFETVFWDNAARTSNERTFIDRKQRAIPGMGF